MSEDDFYTPTDTDALRMENELLSFEVRFLKLRGTVEVERLEGRLEEAERTGAWFQSRSENLERQVEDHVARLAEAKRAEQDFILLLRRLANSPIARVLRFWESFRILEQRYLDKDA